jgi:L-lactate dehydrogenase complex protein LldF
MTEGLAYKAWYATMSNRKVYDFAMTAGRLIELPFIERGVLKKGIGPMGQWTATRDLPPVARKTFGERWKTIHSKRLKEKDNV